MTTMKRLLTLAVLLLMAVPFVPFSIPPARAAPPVGLYFDHVVIIAMENTPYESVFGCPAILASNGFCSASACPSGSAPFLCSMLPFSSTVPAMNNYGATAADGNDFNGCSAACYVGLMAGYTYGISDGYGSLNAANFVADRMAPVGLTWQAYCESGCPRGNDHFPFTAFTDTQGSSNIFAGSSVSTSTFITAANVSSPMNLLWFTPTDSHNMHDNSVTSGDTYLKNFLVGSTGSISAPATGSLLKQNVFTNVNFRTLLYLWWDECGGNHGNCDPNNDAPNVEYGKTVKANYVSPDITGIDEYATIRTLELNWGFSAMAQGDSAAASNSYNTGDIFTTPTAPLLGGWGGPRLIDTLDNNASAPASSVFTGEHQSDFEQIALRETQRGYNAIRGSFAPYCGIIYNLNEYTSPINFEGDYNSAHLQRAISIAQHYDLWLIVDYHGFTDLQNSTTVNCWLNFWNGVVTQFRFSYSKIVWEPLNEPNGLPGSNDVQRTSNLSTDYQRLINQTRALGDVHWIVVQNLCSFGCSVAENQMYLDYPTVTDPQSKVFESLHTYLDYPSHSGSWNNATADSVARTFWLNMRNQTRWPNFSTEGGADYLSGSPPDCIECNTSLEYSKVSVRYMQTLVNLEDTAPRMGRLNWPAASWASPCGCTYGGFANGQWGSFVTYASFTGTLPPPPPNPAALTPSPTSASFSCVPSCTPGSRAVTISAVNYVPGTGAVAYACASNPTTCGSASPSITGPSSVSIPSTGSVSFTVTILPGTQTGTWNMTVTMSENNGTNVITATARIVTSETFSSPSPDYTLSASPTSVSFNAGTVGMFTVTVTPRNGFTATVGLTTSTVPSSGLTTTCSPTSIPGGSGSSTCTMSSSTVSTYSVTVTGASGVLVHTAVVGVTVTAAPDYTMSATPSSLTIQQGTSGTSTVTVTSINTFAGTVTLTVVVAPQAPSATPVASLNPTAVTLTSGSSASSTLTITVGAASPVGSYNVTTTGTSGQLSHSARVTLSVFASPPPPPPPPPPQTQQPPGSPAITSGGSTLFDTGVVGIALIMTCVAMVAVVFKGFKNRGGES